MFGTTNVGSFGFFADSTNSGYGQLLSIGGLTFYKKYVSDLNADYSVGSPVATFTNNTSNTPVFNANGISMSVARADELVYAIAGNRTAASESIIMKIVPSFNKGTGSYKYLLDSDTKQRRIDIETNGNFSGGMNVTDSGGSIPYDASTSYTANTPIVIAMTGSNTGTNKASWYTNGTLQSPTGTAWTVPAWGTSWYLGSRYTGDAQGDVYISSIAIFNRELTAAEVAAVGSLL